jgi:hypothetical protein
MNRRSGLDVNHRWIPDGGGPFGSTRLGGRTDRETATAVSRPNAWPGGASWAPTSAAGDPAAPGRDAVGPRSWQDHVRRLRQAPERRAAREEPAT